MNPVYTFTRIIALLLLTLVLCSNAQIIWAQDAAENAAQTKTDTKESEAAQKAAPEKTTPPPASNGSPFDYEASEEISQDLSVSFPVDI
jgi:hypothetical protein